MRRSPERSCPPRLAIALAVLIVVPAGVQGQTPGALDQESLDFRVELRVGLQDYFEGRLPDGGVAKWQARYREEGTLTFTRERDEAFDTYRIAGRHLVTGLMADAAPVIVDACGNQWSREWRDPAQVETDSRVALELVDLEEAQEFLAIWYEPISFSLMDPGGARGMNDCRLAVGEDEPTRRTLSLDPSPLAGKVVTEAGLEAIRGDGLMLLGVVSWTDLVRGEEVERRVDYGDDHIRFRARLTLSPAR
jgi:hypothetical protein